jgi:mono/diheme cytochrome c family protein
MTRIRFAVFALACLIVPADAAEPSGLFARQDGKSIYEGVCQGCHMAGARGAVGAGIYPALAGNPRLETAGYPVSIILNGQKAMPRLGPYFSDQQIANVVNYVRTNFGNRYRDKVTAADVKALR